MADLKQSQFPIIAPLLTDQVAFVSDPGGTPANGLTDFSTLQALIGGGAVDSVNGQTGTVVIDADDISDASTTNKFTTAGDISKLAGIEAGATADQTGAEIKSAYEAEADTNAFTDAEQTKLAGIEAGATTDQTGAEIKSAYEAEADTNAFTDAEQTKLAGIEAGATADQSDAEIETAYNNQVGVVSQGDAEAGTSTTVQRWTPQRVGQAIAALAPSGGGSTQEFVGSDLTGAADDGVNILVSGQDNTPRGAAFSFDGTRAFMVGTENNLVYSYDLPNPGTLVGMNHDSVTFSPPEAGSSITGVAVSLDGLKMWIMDSTNDRMLEYDLASEWSLSPAPTFVAFLSMTATGTAPVDMDISSDGTKLVGIGNNNTAITWDLPTPNTIVGATQDGFSFNATTLEPQAFGVKWDWTGKRLFITGNTDSTYQINLPTAFSLDGAVDSGLSFNHNTGSGETIPRSVNFSADGTKMFQVGQGNDRFTQTSVTAVPITNVTSVNGQDGDVVLDPDDLDDTSTTNKFISPDQSNRLDDLEDLFKTYKVMSGEYTGKTFNSTSISGGATGIIFKPDGLVGYLTDAPNDSLAQFNLGTPWEIDTASDPAISVSILPSGIVAGNFGPQDIKWKPDGTRFFIVDSAQNNVWQYDVSTPWDITTITTLVGLTFFSFAAAFSRAPITLDFSPDGTKMFITDLTNDTFESFPVGTPWDMSTVGAVETPAPVVGALNIRTMMIDQDTGEFAYLGDFDTSIVHEYSLPTPYSAAGAVPTGRTLDLTGQNASLQGIAFRSDGKVFFTVESGTDGIFQYSMGIDSVPFTFADHAKLDGIEEGATAGGGGGGLRKDYVLFENLTAGDPVARRAADGQIEGVVELTGQITKNNVSTNQGSNAKVGIAYSPIDDRYLAVYQRSSDNFIVARAGTRSGQSISWGAEVNMSVEAFLDSEVVYNSTDDAFVIHMKRVASTTVIAQGATISAGVPVREDSVLGVGQSLDLVAGNGVEVPGQSTTLIFGYGSNEIRGALINTSNVSSLVKGGEIQVGATNNSPVSFGGQDAAWDPTNNCFWFFYNKEGFGTGTCIPTVRRLDVSGNSLTAGAEFTLPYTGGGPSNSDWHCNIEYDSGRDKMILTLGGVGISPGGRDVIHAWIMDPADGVTPTFTASQVLFDDADPSTSRYQEGQDLFYDTGLDKWYLYGNDLALDDTFILPFTPNVGETGFDVDSRIQVDSPSPGTSVGSFHVAYPNNETGTFVLTEGDASGTFETVVYTPASSTNAGEFIGFLAETGLATETKPVNVKGGIDTNQTGLTPLLDYFMDNNGALSTVDGSQKQYVGKALDATTLQIADFEGAEIEGLAGRVTTNEADILALQNQSTPGTIIGSFVFSEAITAGDAVALNEGTGEVELVFEQSGVIGASQGLATMGSTNFNTQGYDSVNDKYAFVYRQPSTNVTVFQTYELIGDVITPVGVETLANISSNFFNATTTFDPTHNVIVLAAGNTQPRVDAALIDLNGVAISTQVGSTINNTNHLDSAYHVAEGSHIQLYKDGGTNNFHARVITVTAPAAATVGGANDLGITSNNNTINDAALVYDTVNDKMFLVYNSVTSGTDPAAPFIVELTVSGTTVTAGTPVALPYTGGAADAGNWMAAFDPDNARIGVFVQDIERATGGATFRAHAGWVVDASGASPVPSAMQLLVDPQAGTTGSRYRSGAVVYDQVIDAFVLFYDDAEAGGEGSVARQFTINVGLSGYDVGPTATLRASQSTEAEDAMTVARDAGAVGKYLYMQGRASLTVRGTSYVTASVTNAADYIGIAAEDGIATETKLVNLPGGIDNNQTGLTIGAHYYMANDGTISTTPSSRYVGQAINATTLNLSGDDQNKLTSLFEDPSPVMAGPMNAGNNTISNVPLPLTSDQVVNKAYADSLIAGGGPREVVVHEIDATGTANLVEFINGQNGIDFSAFKRFRIEGTEVTSDNASNSSLNLNFSLDTVPNYDLGTNHIWQMHRLDDGGLTQTDDVFDARIKMTENVITSAADRVTHFDVDIFNPSSATFRKLVRFNSDQHLSANQMYTIRGGGQWKQTGAILAISVRLSLGAANISGNFKLIGIN